MARARTKTGSKASKQTQRAAKQRARHVGWDARLNRIATLLEQKDYLDAIDEGRRLAAEPGLPPNLRADTFAFVGVAYKSLSMNEQAVTAFRQALDSDRTDAYLWFNLALVAAATGRLVESRTGVETALAIVRTEQAMRTGDTDTIAELLKIDPALLRAQMDAETARRVAADIAAEPADDDAATAIESVAADDEASADSAGAGEAVEATADAEITGDAPADAEAGELDDSSLAESEVAEDDTELRIERLREDFDAMSAMTDREIARRPAGFTLGQLGDQEEAYAEAQHLLGQEQFRRAEDAFRRVLKIDDSTPEPWSNLGAILIMRGRRADAEAALTRALELDPELPSAREMLNDLRSGAGNEDLKPQFIIMHRVPPDAGAEAGAEAGQTPAAVTPATDQPSETAER